MGAQLEQREFGSRGEWRAWLEANHGSAPGLWLVFRKKHTGRRGLSYDEAVEEAICFGWIDGLVKRLDDERYRQRLTPRSSRGATTWSESNLKRARRMIDAGLMTDAGRRLLGDALERYEAAGEVHRPPRADAVDLPAELRAMLEGDAAARAAFEALPPSHQRQHLGWVMDAKKTPTRARRMAEVVRVLASGSRLGLK
jgi:uncharacterized protein YdeI (YjbR/CyaY-like superfamily)